MFTAIRSARNAAHAILFLFVLLLSTTSSSGDSTGAAGLPSTLGWYQIPNTMTAPLCPPADGQPVQAGNCENVIDAWSSGAADIKRNRLMFMGGGHNDYSGNEVYALDLNTLSILRIVNSSIYDGHLNEAYVDGNPTSRHTYGGLSYIASMDKMFMHGGGLFGGYGRSVATWLFDTANLTWKRQDPVKGTPVVANCCNYQSFSAYDPVTDAVYFAGAGDWWRYAPQTNTMTNLAPRGINGLGTHGTAVVDSVHHVYLLVGGKQVWQADLTQATPQIVQIDSQLSGCSALISASFPGLAYDPVQNKIVAWIGGSSVILYDVPSKTCNTVSFSGGPGPPTSTGTHGRWQYFPSLNVFALVNSVDENAWVLRMTAGGTGGSTGGTTGGTTGPVITGVNANSITTTGATISWTTDTPATSIVEYGTTPAYGSVVSNSSIQVNSHAQPLSGLTAGTMYHYRVRSKDSRGVESTSAGYVFSSHDTTDTIPPRVSVTAPAANTTASGTVTVTARASDDVGVAQVQFLLDGANLGHAVTSAPYTMTWDTTAATNGVVTLSAAATDPSGNVGNAIGVEVTVANSTNASTADFHTRCAAPGVIKCEGWDDPSDFTPASGGRGYGDGLYPASDGAFRGTMDTSTKVSGAGSLKFTIPPGSEVPFSANPTGLWKAMTGPDIDHLTSFGQNTTFYMQFRVRVDSPMLDYDWSKNVNSDWKVFIAFGPIPGPSCTGAQFVQVNGYQRNILAGYTSCGTPSLVTNGGHTPYDLEQGDYSCPYRTDYATDPTCFRYVADTWITEYWVVQIGSWGQPNTHFEAFAALPGQPLTKFIDLPNFVFNKGGTERDAIEEVILQPYFTRPAHSATTPRATMWYDELIISTEPIAAPKQ